MNAPSLLRTVLFGDHSICVFFVGPKIHLCFWAAENRRMERELMRWVDGHVQDMVRINDYAELEKMLLSRDIDGNSYHNRYRLKICREAIRQENCAVLTWLVAQRTPHLLHDILDPVAASHKPALVLWALHNGWRPGLSWSPPVVLDRRTPWNMVSRAFCNGLSFDHSKLNHTFLIISWRDPFIVSLGRRRYGRSRPSRAL